MTYLLFCSPPQTMPTSILADWLFRGFLLPYISFLGMALIAAGFILLNLMEFLEKPEEAQEDSDEEKKKKEDEAATLLSVDSNLQDKEKKSRVGAEEVPGVVQNGDSNSTLTERSWKTDLRENREGDEEVQPLD